MHTQTENPPLPTQSPELWGGFECTVNRVGESYMDQLELSGHAQRESDLDLLREIGFKAVRYPVLWERLAPQGMNCIDWSWPDRRLKKLRELNIRPIVGLLHHGSGPKYTNLLDPRFPELFAEYAGAVAERYPWIDAYTPINEPLTTARFSCLYGHWFPHDRDPRKFLGSLLNQCRATILAMRKIREVNPRAQLIQTEDLGKTHSTAQLAYQSEFENERRWLSLDLLSGRVDGKHPLRKFLSRQGISDGELAWFLENPLSPDILGFNYYLTSERFLDHRVDLYPACPIGGNGQDVYVDVEAARVLKEDLAGAGALLREAWQRFNLPVALTELHNGCTREEQARWFVEQYRSAAGLLSEGVDLRAVTAWALLGSFNWNTLVTREGAYEPGVYDIRAAEPLPTVMVKILQSIASGKLPDSPFLKSPGWWRKPSRHTFGVCYSKVSDAPSGYSPLRVAKRARPILITGRTGTLGRAFAKICCERGLEYQLLSRGQMDIADMQSVNAAIEWWRPWAIVNTAGYVRVDDAEFETERCSRENIMGPAMLAAACANRGIKLLSFSSDLVFDGQKSTPYMESDSANPLNWYGRSKAEAERAVLALSPTALMIRTSAFFGPWDEYNFVTATLRALHRGEEVTAVSDYVVSPTYVPDLVHASLNLLVDDARGIWHLANQGSVTWSELAMMAADMAGVGTGLLTHSKNCDWRARAVRPRYSVLRSERADLMPSLMDGLSRYFAHPDLSFESSMGRFDVESGFAA
ncbi:MAG: family 1 glycosylhydrolase [Candidatus Angelobacter sp.]